MSLSKLSTASKYDLAKLILRITFGGLMLTHGIPKLMKLFAGGEIKFMNFLGLGSTASLALVVFAEVICAIFLIIGFKTKWAAIPLIITMLVAAFVAHGSDPIGKKEKALMYSGAYLAIGLMGAGRYSIDGAMNKNVDSSPDDSSIKVLDI